jgi:hypothetical protein
MSYCVNGSVDMIFSGYFYKVYVCPKTGWVLLLLLKLDYVTGNYMYLINLLKFVNEDQYGVLINGESLIDQMKHNKCNIKTEINTSYSNF